MTELTGSVAVKGASSSHLASSHSKARAAVNFLCTRAKSRGKWTLASALRLRLRALTFFLSGSCAARGLQRNAQKRESQSAAHTGGVYCDSVPRYNTGAATPEFAKAGSRLAPPAATTLSQLSNPSGHLRQCREGSPKSRPTCNNNYTTKAVHGDTQHQPTCSIRGHAARKRANRCLHSARGGRLKGAPGAASWRRRRPRHTWLQARSSAHPPPPEF